MDLGVFAWGVGEVFFPSNIVKAWVRSSIGVQETATWVVVELNPQSVELHCLK